MAAVIFPIIAGVGALVAGLVGLLVMGLMLTLATLLLFHFIYHDIYKKTSKIVINLSYKINFPSFSAKKELFRANK
jgi:hypothetical protein